MTRKYAVICPYCKEKFFREDTEFVQYKNRYYHKKCYDIINQDNIEKEKLEDTIKKLFNIEALSPLIKKQIKNYHEDSEYNYTYSGMRKTLEYFFHIKNGDVSKAHGIGIIPYVYKEAEEYYYNLFLIEEKNKNKEIDNYNIINMTISAPQRKPIKIVKEIKMEEDE